MHLLQSPYWGQLKAQFGWRAKSLHLVGQAQPTLILFRKLPLGLNFAYVPKGPAINWLDSPSIGAALYQVRQFARQRGTVFLKIEPDTPQRDLVRDEFLLRNFRLGRTVQPPNTILLKIDDAEADILGRMKSKTRYNIRLAKRKEVTIRFGSRADAGIFKTLSDVTSARNDFGVHSLAYYQAAMDCFPAENRALLIAEYQGQPLAALMVFAWQDVASYLYGASSNAERNRMPTYLLQWEAIRWARERACHTYDLWGIPDASPDELEAEFQNRDDGLWGVYRFKRGFGGQIVRSMGAFDYVYNKPLYKLMMCYLNQRG